VTAFDLQPTLRGALVELRPLRSDDFERLFAVASDPEIWEQHPNPDRCTRPVFTEFFRGAMESRGAFLVLDAQHGHAIGSSRYHAYDERNREVEIGWSFLARSCWGGTYNHEMKQLMLRNAFRFVDRVSFVIGEHNVRSRRAIERIGATLLRAEIGEDGNPRVVYTITRDAFARGLGAREHFGEAAL
jgi:RimJ/RimL family protein N-acetyltransferase